MKLTARDSSKIAWIALLVALLIGLAIAAGLWSTGDTGKARAERDAAAARKLEIEKRLGRVRTEEQEIKARTQQFQQMELAGMIGQEKRLEWTELLRDLQRRLRLPGMNYEFGPQVPLESVAGADYAYHSSQLKIQLRVLHEEDLLNFVGQLQKEAKALVVLRGCKLSRLPGANPAARDAAQLIGECTMEWITLRRASGTKQP
ncbi:MAG: hypothetical protein WAS49_12585 [Candidatus Dechloromonas phosphoritropha]|jgi:Tfp pilus assembly protein PilN|nr:hypothetical protein [Candidatus Dechloromonas phosphoritropha]MBP8785936.1 hypothetical protein [Azonexus sp.]MBP9228939.1 hypothetical protein [Azonexus sp.]